MIFYMTDSLLGIYSDTSSISLAVSFIFCMKFTLQITSRVVENSMIGLYLALIGKQRLLSKLRLRQQARIEKSQTAVERDILVQWVRK